MDKIIKDEYYRGQIMAYYNTLHEIDSHKNYGINSSVKKLPIELEDTEKLAEYIHNNYNKMDDCEMARLASKLTTKDDIKSRLLSFELQFYQPKESKEMSLDSFLNEAKKVLHRYHQKAGGYYIEDSEWTVHRNDSDEYSVMPNEVVLENSVSSRFVTRSADYLGLLIDRLNKIASNISVKLDFENSEEEELCWLLLRCVESEDDQPEIGL